jgi:competence protein ComEC
MDFGMFFRRIPFFRFLIPCITGILLYKWYPLVSPGWICLALALSVFVLILTLVVRKVRMMRFAIPSAIFIQIFFLFFGYYRAGISYPDILPPEGEITCIAKVSGCPSPRNATVRAVLEIRYILNGEQWQTSSEKILAYIKKDSSSLNLADGDVLILTGRRNTIRDAGNPGEFSFTSYMETKGVYQSVYADSGKWAFTGEHEYGIASLGSEIREKLLRILKEKGISDREYAMVAALALGYTQEIDPETRNAFAAAGAMHILSVSGLHVGTVYLLLDFLLVFSFRRKILKWIKPAILILALWAFAVISGLSPSVNRSAIMLSFVIAGKASGRNISILHSLSLSAFILILDDPYCIFDLGFQLSYLAVAGIAVFYPLIRNFYTPGNKVAGWMWSLCAVSLAAQITTLPLSLWCFHQFPNYFLPSNYIVIPLSSAILYTAIIFFAVSGIPALALLTGKLLTWMTQVLNAFVAWIEQLPGAVSENISCSVPEMAIGYIMVFLLGLYLKTKKHIWLNLLLVSMIVLVAFSFFFRVKTESSGELVVFSFRDGQAVLYREGKENVLLVQDTTNLEKNNLVVESYGINRRSDLKQVFLPGVLVALPGIVSHDSLLRLVRVRNKVIFIPGPEKYRFGSQVISPHILIIGKCSSLDTAVLSAGLKPGCIVLDGTLPFYKEEKWQVAAESHGIVCWNIKSRGAFVLPLNKTRM